MDLVWGLTIVHVVAVGADLIAVRQIVEWKIIAAGMEHVLHQIHVVVIRVGKETVHAQLILAMQ
jgi:hypothetical protein